MYLKLLTVRPLDDVEAGTVYVPTSVVPLAAAVRTTSAFVERVAVIVDPAKTASFIVAVIFIEAPSAKLSVPAADTDDEVKLASNGFVVSL